MLAPNQQKPVFETINKIDFLPVETFHLNNGVPVSVIKAGSQDVTKIDIEFPAGSVQAGIPLVASTTANLIQEGTLSKTSMEISEKIDFLGAYLETQSYHHSTIVTFICLTRYLSDMLELVEDLIKAPAFHPHEYEIYLQKKHEEFILEGEKVKTIASRQFLETIFGPNHPYGRQLHEEHFHQISLQQIKTFHQLHYQPELCKIYIAGQPGPNLVNLLNSHLGEISENHTPVNDEAITAPSPSDEKYKIIKKPGVMQSALRIGRPLFNNHHPDYIPLQILNTILGGYFGSRLMTSVREKKGLTYGIGSFIMPLNHSGIWSISSEVAVESRDKTVNAIFEEFEILQQQIIPEDELEMVKNYMMGELLRTFDGPFSTIDIYRKLQEQNMNFQFYENMIAYIRNVTTLDLQKLARTYLNRKDFYIVAAGV
jgi:zinc protease